MGRDLFWEHLSRTVPWSRQVTRRSPGWGSLRSNRPYLGEVSGLVGDLVSKAGFSVSVQAENALVSDELGN